MNFINKILKEANEEQFNDFFSEADALVDKYKAKDCEIEIDYRNDYSASINRVIVPPYQHNEGIGTNFMVEITALADHYNVLLTLSPSNYLGSNVNRLKKFYTRFGFKMNLVRKADHRYSDSMIRTPKQ